MNVINGKIDVLLEESPLIYYWLGFILADGHLSSQNRLIVTLGIEDKDHLFRLAELLKTTISTYSKNCSLKIMDTKLIQVLKNKFEINNRKTYFPPSLKIFQKMPNDLLLSLIIGYIDGDGCIYANGKLAVIRMSCHRSWDVIYKFWIRKLYNLLTLQNVPTINYCSHKNHENAIDVTIGAFPVVRYLKKFALVHGLPILQRKWNCVDINMLTQREQYLITVGKIKNLPTEKMTAREIASIIQLNYQWTVEILRKENILYINRKKRLSEITKQNIIQTCLENDSQSKINYAEIGRKYSVAAMTAKKIYLEFLSKK